MVFVSGRGVHQHNDLDALAPRLRGNRFIDLVKRVCADHSLERQVTAKMMSDQFGNKALRATRSPTAGPVTCAPIRSTIPRPHGQARRDRQACSNRGS
jgi:hypothetical protein